MEGAEGGGGAGEGGGQELRGARIWTMLDRVVTAVRCAGLSPLRTGESEADSRAISWGSLRRRIKDCLLN